MHTSTLSARRLVGAAAIALALAAGITPAQAAPPLKPGKVTGLAATVTKPAAAYQVASTWNAATNATSYRVKLVNSAGTVLDSSTTTTTAWVASTTSTVGTVVRVLVTPFRGTRKGAAASISKTLPDLTAPTGIFTVAYDDTVSTTVTITQTALADDLSAPAAITREIDFGDGAGFQSFPAGAAAEHTYAATDARYVPVVRLTDEAGNSSTVSLDAVVIGDEEAPVGTYDVSSASAWARLTRVSISQSSLSDAPFSPNDKILREILWGDGTAKETWSTGAVATHVFATGGTFTPRVFLTDEAGNTSEVTGSSVTVTVDAAGPVVKLTLPRTGLQSISRWTELKGTAKDGAGTGVKQVRVRAVEKRGAVWYAYKPLTRTWAKAGATKAGAFTKAGQLTVTPTATGTWTARLRHLRTGTLSYRVVGLDRVANRSKVVAHTQLLTRS
jgi:hypothetical protein